MGGLHIPLLLQGVHINVNGKKSHVDADSQIRLFQYDIILQGS